MSPLSHQLRWLIGVRLVVITSIALAYFLHQLAAAPGAPRYGPIYMLAGWVYLASLFYLGLLRLLRRHEITQAYLQFLGDLVLVSALVYFFGGTSSPFSILYFVVIIVASALLRRRAGVLVATLSGVLYAATVLLSLHFEAQTERVVGSAATASIPWAPFTAATLYDLSVHIVSFFAVALLASYLAESASRAERELEERTEDLADLQVVHQDVIESISSGIVTTDLEGNITSINRAGNEILGRGASALAGLPIASSGLFNEQQWKAITERSALGDSLRDEVEYKRDGESRYVGFSLSRLESADGSLRGYILIFQDLTNWHGLQEELRIKDRMAAVGELAAGLAHEVGNPLAAISGSVQLLRSSGVLAGESRKLLNILLKESQRLDRTIKGFLRFARPHERSIRRFDVARLLSEHIELLRHSSEVSEKHRLELELEPDGVLLTADPDQMSQIFWNLARNALRAMPNGGDLRVRAALDHDHYRITFADTGLGMPEERRARMFQPFQSFFDGGLGIGMAIVYRIVEEHGGRVNVESQPGHGTEITVELPGAAVATPAGAEHA